MDSPELTFIELSKVASDILSANICSNDFQLELEIFLEANFNDENISSVVNLLKGLSSYKFKSQEFEQLLAKFLLERADQMSVRQIETVMWSLSRELTDKRDTEVRQLGYDVDVI